MKKTRLEGEDLIFDTIESTVHSFAETIENNLESIIALLLEYESFEVATDEINRTLDVLKNLSENKEYFKIRTGAVTTFLPRNQPLYALTCFVLVPSLMTTEVHFRIPHSLKKILPKVLQFLNVHHFFDNIIISNNERLAFLKERSALEVNASTGFIKPVTSTVIFTGTPVHADQLRILFNKRTLFITNGAGHNPIIVTNTADIKKAVTATLTLNLYNQGQDCAAPNSIMVQNEIFEEFMTTIHSELSKIKIGPYFDRSCRVGPISNPDDLVNIQTILTTNRDWIDPVTPGNIRTIDAIVEPTIITKPLKEGGNYEESFAPILFIQHYTLDTELSLYFENEKYYKNAMYITVYGESSYIQTFVVKQVNGKKIHTPETVLINKHLHEFGAERGTQPYGGYGYGASSVSINGYMTPKPTLPQRDIYELVGAPLTLKYSTTSKELTLTTIEYKNVEKILKLKITQQNENETNHPERLFLDLNSVSKENRYVDVMNAVTYSLILEKNADFISEVNTIDRNAINMLRELLFEKQTYDLTSFTTAIYKIPKSELVSDEENANSQLHLFKIIYKLLFNAEIGPKISPFLFEVDNDIILPLLEV